MTRASSAGPRLHVTSRPADTARIGFEKRPFVTMRSRVDGETPISRSTFLVRSIVSVGWQSGLGQREACQARAFLLRAPFLTSRPVSPAQYARRANSPRGGLGEVAEWLKAPHSKCGILARVSWVQIPPSPPPNFEIASVISPGDNGRPLHIMTAAKTR